MSCSFRPLSFCHYNQDSGLLKRNAIVDWSTVVNISTHRSAPIVRVQQHKIIKIFREQNTSDRATLRMILCPTATLSLPLVFSTSCSTSGNPSFQSPSSSITLKLLLIYRILQQKEAAAVTGRTHNKGSAVRNTRPMITALVNDARTNASCCKNYDAGAMCVRRKRSGADGQLGRLSNRARRENK